MQGIVPVLVSVGQHGYCRDIFSSSELALDFAQLDAESADLYLPVPAADELQQIVGAPHQYSPVRYIRLPSPT